MISRADPVNPVNSKDNPGLASAEAWNRADGRAADASISRARAGWRQELLGMIPYVAVSLGLVLLLAAYTGVLI